MRVVITGAAALLASLCLLVGAAFPATSGSCTVSPSTVTVGDLFQVQMVNELPPGGFDFKMFETDPSGHVIARADLGVDITATATAILAETPGVYTVTYTARPRHGKTFVYAVCSGTATT